jgi:serine/threonine protein kinase
MAETLKTVGRYEVLREVGRGGMAVVYLARQTDLDRFVALKELAAFHAADPAFAERFVRESRVAGSLSHPNIVTVHDYFEHDGTPYIAMEYVERGSLRGYVGQLSLAQVSGVFEGLLAGLAHAEQHGIVHRDLKPENLMVTADGRVKIADFGIAKATTEMKTGAFVTATGHTVGTPTYMAPEQAMAQQVGPWTDLYSVGCMAFELFTGKPPFHDTDAPMAILLKHVNEEIPRVEPVDDGIADWVQHLLVKDPEKRTRSAVDAWDEYEEIVIGLLGPRWRREARLLERTTQIDTPKPLTPAPFEGTSADPVVSAEFESFAWGPPARPEREPEIEAPPPEPAPPPPPEPAPPPPQPAPPPPPEVAAESPRESPPEPAETVMPTAPPPAPPAAKPARNPLPIVIGAGVVIAAILGFVLGSSGGGTTDAGEVVKSNAAMKLKVPGAWADAPPPQIPGLTLADAKAATGEGSTVSFGTQRGVNTPSLLSPALLQATGGVPKNRTAVKLGPKGVQAYRYGDVRVRDLNQPVTLYTVPTAQGVVTIACVPSSNTCDGVANTLDLLSSDAFPIGPSEDYAKTLGNTFNALDKAVAAGQAKLTKAKTPSAQAVAARQLQNAYRRAAATLRNQQLGPADRGLNARLVAALAGLAKSYGQAATAAAGNNKAAYKKAGAAITKDQGELSTAIANLRDAGYEVQS